MESDADYFSRRAAEEREAGLRAAHPNARRAHLELAEAYEHRVRVVRANERRATVHLVSAA